jgi:pimeloyl-ACP methyl ester carboxylesterase
VNPPTVGRDVAAAIPGARYEEPSGIGHLPEIEAPNLILRWLHAQMDDVAIP